LWAGAGAFGDKRVRSAQPSSTTSTQPIHPTDDIWITVEAWDTTPSSLNLDEWQDAAEITIDWPGGQLRVVGTEDGPWPELPLDEDLPAGPYRLRAAGRNRDDGEARGPELPVEEYLLQLWPAARKDATGSPEETGRSC
jgi:hypothetical protein